MPPCLTLILKWNEKNEKTLSIPFVTFCFKTIWRKINVRKLSERETYLVIYMYIYIYVLYICLIYMYIYIYICLLIGIILRWGFLIWELIFLFVADFFVLILVVFVLFLLSLRFGQISPLAFFRWFTTTSDRNAESCNRIPSNYCLP